jgi:plasmid stabilization system protein ParE
MAFLVEITPMAEAQIEQIYQWYRDRNPEFAVGVSLPAGESLVSEFDERDCYSSRETAALFPLYRT